MALMAIIKRPGGEIEVAGRRDEHDEEEFCDEEFREKEQYDVEEMVVRFINEPPIRYNAWPDSDDENEEGDLEHENVNRGSRIVYKGQVFSSAHAFNETVLDHALNNCCNIKQIRYDKNKLLYKCVGSGCSWRVYCSKRGEFDKWVVRVLQDRHSCYPNGDCEMPKFPIIAMLFVDKIRSEPDYFMPKKMEELIYEKWRINVSRHQRQSARNIAMRWIEKAYYEQFQRLRDYQAEIMLSNPNSTIAVDTHKNLEGLGQSFTFIH